MSQNVSVSFRIDEQLKENVEGICWRMGLTLPTALTVFCRKIEQEQRIPFEIRAGSEPPSIET